MNSLILNGKRSLELQKWRNLRFAVSLVQNVSAFSNSFSSASAAQGVPKDGRKGRTFTVSYLVDSLGFTTKLAESISRKVSFEDKGNPDSVLNLLTSYGFADSQISNIITDYPGLLLADAERFLAPKLQFLQSRGASTSELTEILSKVPKILVKKGEKTISLHYDLVKDIIEADKSFKFEKLSHSLPQGSKQENKIRNILALRDIGVPQKLLFLLLVSEKQPVCGKERFEESLKKIVEMGFDPTTPKFVQALNVIYNLSDKAIEEKVNVYRSLGFAVADVWDIFKKYPLFMALSEKNILNSSDSFLGLGFTRDEFTMMVKRHPTCIAYSIESVKKKTEFLVKKMNWPFAVLRPEIFSYSMEKRIVPRCNVIKALLSKGLLGKGSELPPLSTVLSTIDQKFLNMYVRKHDDKEFAAELMAIFSGDRVGSYRGSLE